MRQNDKSRVEVERSAEELPRSDENVFASTVCDDLLGDDLPCCICEYRYHALFAQVLHCCQQV